MTLEQWLASAEALLDLDAKGAIAPHGIGGHARTLLTEAAALLRSQPAGVRVAEGMKDRLKMLVSEYWDLAYTEGKEGRTTDTPNGDAGRAWWQITELLEQFEALSRFPALEPQQEEAGYQPKLIEYEGEGEPYAEFVSADEPAVTRTGFAGELLLSLDRSKLLGIRVYTTPTQKEQESQRVSETSPTPKGRIDE